MFFFLFFYPLLRPLFVYTAPKVAVMLFIQNEFHHREKKNLYLWSRQWHKNRFELLSICLQSQCNAIITCFHGPGHIWLALQKKKKKNHTRYVFFSSFLIVCALLERLAHISEIGYNNKLGSRTWNKKKKNHTHTEWQFALSFRTRLSRGLNILNANF